MEHFDIVQALARAAMGGNREIARNQVQRLVDRLVEAGDASEAKALRAMLARSGRAQAVEPLGLRASDLAVASRVQQRLTRATSVPVDRESGAPLCEILFDVESNSYPVLPATAEAACGSLLREWTHEEQLELLGVPVSRSLLIYGPPGTGKTTLALSMSTRLGLPAVVARLDGLISSLLGNTARNLGSLFDFCSRYECVLVLDEFDAVAKVRDDANEVGEIKRVVNALLQNLDRRATVGLTVAVTNHEHLLDSAIWRRFEHQIHLGLPDETRRFEIARRFLPPEFDAEPLARLLAFATPGLSGADVRTLTQGLVKQTVLAGPPAPTPVDALRSAANAAGANVSAAIYAGDRDLANSVSRAFTDMTQSELAQIFGRDRKTISRWLQGEEGIAGNV